MVIDVTNSLETKKSDPTKSAPLSARCASVPFLNHPRSSLVPEYETPSMSTNFNQGDSCKRQASRGNDPLDNMLSINQLCGGYEFSFLL